ncbi:ABC transporter substrate-binding protein [Microbacterium indicum]|uniref:ABC transporter substrate-binding protein n=1 Tax=Microbacterium indicum TaxID=358100 RepID=UPI0004177D48|nr:extracellular solute-binding protein [Microbacterium indicum]
MKRSTKLSLLSTAVLGATALVLSGCAGGTAAEEYDPDEQVSITFTWWGNDDRAQRYNDLIDRFNEEYPNIEVKGSFTDFAGYWTQRQTEAAGGGLPDVMQFDYSYLRQYAENGLITDLSSFEDVDTSAISDSLLGTGQLDGTQYGLPLGYSTWATFLNDDLLAEYGVEPYAGGTSYEDYSAWMADATEKSGGAVFGGTDYSQRIQNFEMMLRAGGGNLFTEDGELGFDEDQLREFWNLGAADIESGAVVPQQQLAEIDPISGFGANLTESELSWSNFIASYLADSGASSVTMAAPPTFEDGSQDLYQQAGLQMVVSSQSEHPTAAAIFLDYVVNSPEAGEIFGTSLGFPASETKLAGATLEGPDQQVADFLDSVSDRIGDAPALPVNGYGSIEQTFWDLGKEIGLGTTSVDDAVSRFFSEADVVLSANS